MFIIFLHSSTECFLPRYTHSMHLKLTLLSSFMMGMMLLWTPLTAQALTLPAPLKAKKMAPLRGTKDLIKEITIWSLGNTKKIKHVWVVLHGDRPNYYVDKLKRARKHLHQQLKKRNEGALLVMPMAHSSQYYKVNPGQGWADLYGKTKGARQQTSKRMRYGLMPIRLFRYFEKKLNQRTMLFQLASFSGAGRIDRAFQESINYYYNNDPTGLNVKNFVQKNLLAQSAADSMVHWSFADAADYPLVRSWTKFLNNYPKIKATLVYDKSRKYPYMADMIQTIASDVQGYKVRLPQTSKTYGRQLYVISARSHARAFWDKLDAMLLRWLP